MCEFGRSHIRVYVLHWFSNHHKPSVCIFKSGLSKDSMSSMSTGLTQRHLKRTAHCMGPLVLWADIDSGSKTSRHTTNDVSVGNKAVCRASLVPAWTQRCFSLLFFSDAEHNALSKKPQKNHANLHNKNIIEAMKGKPRYSVVYPSILVYSRVQNTLVKVEALALKYTQSKKVRNSSMMNISTTYFYAKLTEPCAILM